MHGTLITIKFTQRWVRHKLKTFHSKVEVLLIYWDKILAHLMRMRIELQDTELDLIGRLIEVPVNIRRYALSYYLSKCKRLYSVAFYQWRSMFPSTYDYYNEV